MNPAARDGYAAMWFWMSGGQPVEQLMLDDVGPVPTTLRLDTAPLARQAVGYILIDPRDWLVLARVAAQEPIRIGTTAYAYPEPMLVWAGWRGERGVIFSGCVNLQHTPTVAGLRLKAGKNFGELGAAQLTRADADDDLLGVGQCLRRFLGIKK